MYSIDGRDRVAELADVPQSSVGAPLPLVVAAEGALGLAYLVELRDPGWDGTSIRVVDANSPAERVAVVEFARPYAHQFGPPNDEAFAGHPLAGRGLRPYGAFEVRDSSWVRGLERMNRVHEHHRPERFARLRHFVFTFHDSTFECVAEGLTVLGEFDGPLSAVAADMVRRLGSPQRAI